MLSLITLILLHHIYLIPPTVLDFQVDRNKQGKAMVMTLWETWGK